MPKLKEMKGKFKRGDRVYITGNIPSYCSHLPHGMNATVIYSYATECDGVEDDDHRKYGLYVDGHFGITSWYEEKHLSFAKERYELYSSPVTSIFIGVQQYIICDITRPKINQEIAFFDKNEKQKAKAVCKLLNKIESKERRKEAFGV